MAESYKELALGLLAVNTAAIIPDVRPISTLIIDNVLRPDYRGPLTELLDKADSYELCEHHQVEWISDMLNILADYGANIVDKETYEYCRTAFQQARRLLGEMTGVMAISPALEEQQFSISVSKVLVKARADSLMRALMDSGEGMSAMPRMVGKQIAEWARDTFVSLEDGSYFDNEKYEWGIRLDNESGKLVEVPEPVADVLGICDTHGELEVTKRLDDDVDMEWEDVIS